MKLLTNEGLNMVLRHALAESERISVKQPRKRYDMYSTGIWDGVRMYGDADYNGKIAKDDILIVKVNKNLGTKKWPDVHESFIVVRIEKICKRVIKCTDEINNYRVYPDAVLAVVRG